MDNTLFQIRVTGILIEDGKLLLVKQRVNESRSWSLPGGKLEHGETIAQGLQRELLEETGLIINVGKLLYVCEKPDALPPLIHMTFLIQKESRELTLPASEFDRNPISDVRMVPLEELSSCGFSGTFIDLLKCSFPESGNYMGLKETIGL